MGTTADNALHVGRETTYGTAVTPTRSFEAHGDSFKREQSILEATGFRKGIQARRSDRVISVNMGGAGSIEMDVLSAGMGMLFEGALDVSTVPVLGSGTYTQTHASGGTDSGVSYTIQMVRSYVDTAGSAVFTHVGSVITGWSLTHEVDGLLTANFDFDFQDVTTATAEATSAYPAGAPFHWGQCVATINGTPVDVRSMEFSADLAKKVDRRYLRGSVLKKKPVRVGLPTFEGTVTADFSNLDLYGHYVNGTIVPITFTWTRDTNTSVALTLPACQFAGESPEASPDDLTAQPVSFNVLHNGTNPAVTLTIRGADQAF